MANIRVFFMYFMAFCVNFSIQIAQYHSKICLAENHAALFIFGDSLFDVGNNNYIETISFLQANSDPYGQTFFNYPTGRFSDGRVIPDFIAEFAKLPLLPPYLDPASRHDEYTYGANFASAGAGALIETRQGTVIDLKTQADHFKQVSKLLRKKLGDAEAKALLARAVYIISVGGNDYSAPFLTNSSSVVLPYSQPRFVDTVIGNISSVIQEIYEEGGRKFGILNVGPLSCFPFLRRFKQGSSIDACQEEQLSKLSILHRDALQKMLQNLQKQREGFKYSLFDFYGAVVEVMKRPSNYGFKVGDVACCGGGAYRGDYSCGGKRGIEEYELCENVTEFVFFDSIHPTDSAAHHFASLMWTGNQDIVQPYNLKQLFEFESLKASLLYFSSLEEAPTCMINY